MAESEYMYRLKPAPGSTVRISRNGSISINNRVNPSYHPSLTSTTPTNSTSPPAPKPNPGERRSPGLSHKYSEAVARFQRRLQQTTPLSFAPPSSSASLSSATTSPPLPQRPVSTPLFSTTTTTTTTRNSSPAPPTPPSSSSSQSSPTSKWRDFDTPLQTPNHATVEQVHHRPGTNAALERARKLVRDYKQSSRIQYQPVHVPSTTSASATVPLTATTSPPPTTVAPSLSSPSVTVQERQEQQQPIQQPNENVDQATNPPQPLLAPPPQDTPDEHLPNDTSGATVAFLKPMKLTGDATVVDKITTTLSPIVTEHRRLFSLVTKGIHCMVVRTPTDNVNPDTEYKRKALDVHMYVTANLKSIVWKTSFNNSTFSVPMSELTGIVCLKVHHVLPHTYHQYSFVKREDPVLRVMISRSTSHWDCILTPDTFQDWISGLSLAYGMQTVQVVRGAGEEVDTDDDDDGMTAMY